MERGSDEQRTRAAPVLVFIATRRDRPLPANEASSIASLAPFLGHDRLTTHLYDCFVPAEVRWKKSPGNDELWHLDEISDCEMAAATAVTEIFND